MTSFARYIAGIAALIGCMGCTPLMSTAHDATGFVGLAGRGGHQGYLPQACLAHGTASQGARLPPGCANALNLLGMVANPEDLLRGRAMGPAYVAPAAAAVERYLGVIADDSGQARQARLIEESEVSN